MACVIKNYQSKWRFNQVWQWCMYKRLLVRLCYPLKLKYGLTAVSRRWNTWFTFLYSQFQMGTTGSDGTGRVLPSAQCYGGWSSHVFHMYCMSGVLGAHWWTLVIYLLKISQFFNDPFLVVWFDFLKIIIIILKKKKKLKKIKKKNQSIIRKYIYFVKEE